MDATGWDERYAQTGLVWSVEPNMFVVEEVTALLSGMSLGQSSERALDLAGGEGRNAVWLAEQGYAVELVEFSSIACEKARASAKQRGVTILTTLADVTREPSLEPADLVLVCYLQLEKDPLDRALRHAASRVAPGGTLLVIAHDRGNLERGYGGPSSAAVLPTVADVVATITPQLLVERAEQVIRTVDTDEGPRDAIDLLVRATRRS